MLKLDKKIIIWLAVFMATFAMANAATEQTVGARSGPPNDWLSYAKFIFPFALSVAAVLSVIMIIIAGLEMMTASEGMRSDAKEKIQNALFGLAVALGIYLILNTVNPALLNLRIDTAGLRVNVEQGSGQQNQTGPNSNTVSPGQTNQTPTTGFSCVRTLRADLGCKPTLPECQSICSGPGTECKQIPISECP